MVVNRLVRSSISHTRVRTVGVWASQTYFYLNMLAMNTRMPRQKWLVDTINFIDIDEYDVQMLMN